MQLPAQSDGVNGAAAPVEGHDSGSSPQQQGGGVRGKAPASSTTSTSPSSPGSPSRSGGGGAGALRDKPVQLLPCPRCESMNTKFCYYNNYSVTQPRHFCRQCQRYWTAGGTLRNVPVGGGSRKKNRHPRGEPYLQQQQRGLGGVSPPGPHPTGPFGIPSGGGQSVLQNAGGHFQQMMSQDMGFAQLNFAQLPGFPANSYHHHHHHPYGTTTMDPVDLAQQVMYGTAPQMLPVAPYFFPQQQQQQQQETQQPAAPPLQNGTTGTVKTEFWSHPSMVAPPPSQALPSNPNPSKNGQTFESSMLLNLGLNNSRPPHQQEPGSQAKPAWDQSQSQHQVDMKPTVRAPTTKNGSPPHGSSTIEEEGSTPTNSYSNSGYEEGDTVSSMWQNIHDIDNIF